MNIKRRGRNRRRFAATLERLEGRALLATLYVDASSLEANPDGSQANPYRQIQAAINSSALDDAASDTIRIAPGVYRETVSVTRSVRLEGPNANIAPAGTRGPEAIILPSVNNPNAGRNIVVKARNVQIAGLTIDGHSDALTGGDVYNGIALNSSSGISNVDVAGVGYTVTGLLVEDNVIRNFTHFGVLADGGDPSDPASISTGNIIRDNTIDNIPYIAPSPIQSDQGRGISIEHNFIADVSGNVITRSATGIQVIYSLLTPPAGAKTLVRDNVIRAYDRGIYVYTMDSGVPAFAVTGNTVAAETSGATPSNVGIDVVRVLDTTTGTIANNNVSGASIGIRLDYSWATAGLTVNGGTLRANGYGVVLTNVDPISAETTKKPVKANLVGVAIQDSTIAALKVENALAPTAVGVTLTVDPATVLTGNARGVVVVGGSSAKLTESPATAPVVTLTSVPDPETSSTTASFAYNVSDNLSSPGDLVVRYSLDGGSLVAATQPINLSGLAPGAHSLVLKVTDQAGNVGSITYAWTVTGTPSLQQPPSTPSLLASSDTGVSATDGITSAKTPTVRGTASAGSIVTLFANTTRLGSTTADSAGNWTFTVGGSGTPVASLADGTYAITATATGTAGISAPSGALTIVVDTQAPTIQASRSPQPNAAGWNNTDVVASYTASDALAGLSSAETGSFTFTNEGKGQSRTFTARDLAGNTASVTVQGINIDKTAPDITLNASSTSLSPSGKNVTVNLTGRLTDGLSGIVEDATYTVTDSYGLYSDSGNATFGVRGKFSFGLRLSATNTSRTTARVYTITVTGRDAAGNVKTTSVTVQVRPSP